MLKKIRTNRWEDENGNWIWEDDFGHFQILVNGIPEITNTFEKALKIYNKYL